jgi:hypothetical protein
MSMPHRQRRIARMDIDAASDIEREALLLVERVNRRIQELRDQRAEAGGGGPSPRSGDQDGAADAPPAQTPPPLGG